MYSYWYYLMKILVNDENTRIGGGCRWKVECKTTKEGIVMHKHT